MKHLTHQKSVFRSSWILKLGVAFLVTNVGVLAATGPCHADDWLSAIFEFVLPSKPSENERVGIDPKFTATHQQSHLIKVVEGSGVETSSLVSFCCDSKGRILAAVCSTTGEIRVYKPDGEPIETWKLSVMPEAIAAAPDGTVVVAGEGRLLRLDEHGNPLTDVGAPHVAGGFDRDKLRASVINQHKASRISFAASIKSFQEMRRSILGLSKSEWDEFTALELAIEKTAQNREGDLTDSERKRVRLRRELVAEIRGPIVEEMSKDQLARLKMIEFNLESLSGMMGAEEMTEDQIEKAINGQITMKSSVASVSATTDYVTVVAYHATGYSFDVWRLNAELEDAECLITGLLGCCGQMDAQCCDDGIYVAENGRHRVTHFGLDGKKKRSWGKTDRHGVVGFGGCCNPMNVAMGANGSVYTAESETGRIKRYDAEGKLMNLVGAAELVPGCKKVSIAVSKDGSHVYMLDITRNHIVVMTAVDEEIVKGEELKSEASGESAESSKEHANVAIGKR